MTPKLNEYDVVEVVRLTSSGRSFHGSKGVARPPAVGDVATVLMICDRENEEGLILEMVDDAGETVWLSEFSATELRLIWKADSQR